MEVEFIVLGFFGKKSYLDLENFCFGVFIGFRKFFFGRIMYSSVFFLGRFICMYLNVFKRY